MSGEEIYAEVARLSKKLITDMLLRMIESAGSYHSWSLSDEDGGRMIKLIRHKQRIICSSFAFQLNKHFNDFKDGNQSLSVDKGMRDWQSLGLSGASEVEGLQAIVERYADAFKEFDRAILKRLQSCIKRPRASIYENPLQVKKLCESFQYAIDSLNLELHFKLALYNLFADRFVESLGPFYRRIDSFLLDQGMLREVPPARIHLRSIEGLSETTPPATLKPNQSATLLSLLQRFKEKSRKTTDQYRNLFPELQQRFASFGLVDYDEQIDQLNLIFKLIFEDEDLPEPIKQQLARLQIYVFITAIQEDGFLRRSSNPARRLLDGIIANEVEIARSGKSEYSGVEFIRQYIDSLASREFITIESYSEMLAGYQDFLKENETSARKTRRAEALRKVVPPVKSKLSEITQPLRMQGTPLILFEKVWFPLLVQIALQKGMNSDPWNKTINMVKKQVWSMIPKANKEDQTELLKTLPTVEHSLHRAMRSLKLNESLQQSMRDYLKLEQQEVIAKTAQNIIEAKRRTRSLAEQSFEAIKEDTTEFDAMMQTGIFKVPSDMLSELNAARPQEPKKINQATALEKGEWVNMMHEGNKILAKLAWKADDSSLFIFVDREGTRICEIDAEELRSRFDSGAVSLMKSGSTDSEKTQFSFMKSI